MWGKKLHNRSLLSREPSNTNTASVYAALFILGGVMLGLVHHTLDVALAEATGALDDDCARKRYEHIQRMSMDDESSLLSVVISRSPWYTFMSTDDCPSAAAENTCACAKTYQIQEHGEG